MLLHRLDMKPLFWSADDTVLLSRSEVGLCKAMRLLIIALEGGWVNYEKLKN